MKVSLSPVLFVCFYHITLFSHILFLFLFCWVQRQKHTHPAQNFAPYLLISGVFLSKARRSQSWKCPWKSSFLGTFQSTFSFWQSVALFTELLNPGDTTDCDSRCEPGNRWFRVQFTNNIKQYVLSGHSHTCFLFIFFDSLLCLWLWRSVLKHRGQPPSLYRPTLSICVRPWSGSKSWRFVPKWETYCSQQSNWFIVKHIIMHDNED